jgi:hypothetical protein
MPAINRSMRKATDNLPVVEPSARGLGVREPPLPNADVDVDGKGHVVLNGRGMSVARHWRDLPYFRIPKRLDVRKVGFKGSNADCCWRLGEGPFTPGPVWAGLELVLKVHDPTKGNVVPNQPVPLSQFQAELAATRASWVLDET